MRHLPVLEELCKAFGVTATWLSSVPIQCSKHRQRSLRLSAILASRTERSTLRAKQKSDLSFEIANPSPFRLHPQLFFQARFFLPEQNFVFCASHLLANHRKIKKKALRNLFGAGLDKNFW